MYSILFEPNILNYESLDFSVILEFICYFLKLEFYFYIFFVIWRFISFL